MAALVFSASGWALDQDDPETERQSFKVMDGFEVSLFASEKDGIARPIQMRWDAQGRLWVICSTAYPQIKPGEPADDKLIILEDSNGDGIADKSTVFASGMLMPMGLELGDGGAYVGVGSELVHFKDLDGDGKADQRRVVLRGFGTGDSHQNINNFTWSPGGELFFCQGLHAFSRVETPWGIEALHSAGVWRLRPRTLRLDGFLGNNMGPQNPWGMTFDDYGQPILFAGNGDGIAYLEPGLVKTTHYKEFPKIWTKYHKLAGGDILNGRHLPESVQGLAITGGFMNNVVDLFGITEDASGFGMKELPPLISSTHTSFRPIDAKVGPDGAIYICDWYNPVIGHYQASFRDPRRDKTHGRIWRVTAKGRPLVEKPKLIGMKAPELLEQLKVPERWTRYQARRILADTDSKEVLPAAAKWIEQLDPKDPQFARLLIEGLAVYESQEAVEPKLLAKLLASPDYRVRAYATRTIGRWSDRLENPLTLLETLVTDENPRVRLEAVLSAAAIPAAHAIEVAACVVDKPMDRFLNFALTQAVHVLKDSWKPAFESGQLSFANKAARLEFVLKADGSKDVLLPLMNLLKSATLQGESRGNVLAVLASIGGPEELALILNSACATSAAGYDAALHARLLGELAKTFRLRKVRPAGDVDASLQGLLKQADANVVRQALTLAGLYRVEALRANIEEKARDKAAAESLRLTAIEALADLGGEKSIEALRQLAQAKPVAPRITAICALARLNAEAAAEAAGELFETKTDADPVPIIEAFLARQGGSDVLAAALAKVKVSQDCAKLSLRAMSSAGREDKALKDVLNKVVGLTGEALAYDAELVKSIVAEVPQGNPANGEKIFRGTLTNCFSCHSIGGAGGQVGPDLSMVGTGMQQEMIVEAVLWPNRQVKENYTTTLVTTKDGGIFQGYRVTEDKQTLTLREPSKERIVQIQLQDIKKRKDIGSVMPEGLTAGLTRAEVRDLIRFLSELGRPGPFAINNPAVVRRWQVYDAAITDETYDPLLIPRYSLASGELPAAELGMGDTRFEVEVTKAGKFQLLTNATTGLLLRVDKRDVALQEKMDVELDAGKHVFHFRIDKKARGDVGLRCEIAPAAGSGGDLKVGAGR